MPHIILKRSDIPAATLQVLDLEPNESQRNLIYDPPGQTKYVDPVVRQIPMLTDQAGTIRTAVPVAGLEAWFLANVADGGGASLTAAEAVQNATDVLDLLGFGSLSAAAGILTVAAINGALTTGTISGGQLPRLLEVLAGRTFTIPQGVQLETGGALSVSPAIGAAGGPAYGSIRQVFDTSSLTISAAAGHLAGFMATSFTYQGAGGAHGEAVVVYNDDGTLFVP